MSPRQAPHSPRPRYGSGTRCYSVHVQSYELVQSLFLHKRTDVVLYGCETWSVILTEGKHRLRVLENRLLRRIFGHKMDEVTGEGRRLHNEELNDVYSSPNIIRVSNQEE